MSLNRRRAPRVKLPSETPLDDGTRNGTETWRNVDGIAFCHWDRWLLRLSLEEPDGLSTIAREFRRRSRGHSGQHDVAEAMLAQLTDLASRLATIGRAASDVLDAVERERAPGCATRRFAGCGTRRRSQKPEQ